MQIKTGMVRSSGLKLGPRDFDLLVTGKVHCLERWRGVIKQGDQGKGGDVWEA